MTRTRTAVCTCSCPHPTSITGVNIPRFGREGPGPRGTGEQKMAGRRKNKTGADIFIYGPVAPRLWRIDMIPAFTDHESFLSFHLVFPQAARIHELSKFWANPVSLAGRPPCYSSPSCPPCFMNRRPLNTDPPAKQQTPSTTPNQRLSQVVPLGVFMDQDTVAFSHRNI